ncbi:MAG: hypothetical protein ABIZ49_10740 [Opitutaceae bacterium]
MTSLISKVLLVLSLTANAGLGFALLKSKPSNSPKVAPVEGATVSRIDASASGDSPQARTATEAPPSRIQGRLAPMTEADRQLLVEAAARFGKTSPLGDPRTVAEKMYRDGYPDDVVSSVVANLIDEWTGYAAIMEARKRGDATARRVSAVFDGGGALQKYMHDLFPDWRERDEFRLQRERALRFGDLPLEKVLQVERIEGEFKLSGRDEAEGTLANNSSVIERHEAKIVEALGQFLTKDELKDYVRFNSRAARRVQEQVAKIEIDDATYDRLLAVEVARGPQVGQAIALAEWRGILSDRQFVQLIRPGGMPGQADAIYRTAGLPDERRVDFFVLIEQVTQSRNPQRSPLLAKEALVQIHAALAVSPENAQRFEASSTATMLKRAAGVK